MVKEYEVLVAYSVSVGVLLQDMVRRKERKERECHSPSAHPKTNRDVPLDRGTLHFQHRFT